jgi:hypothetical protein
MSSLVVFVTFAVVHIVVVAQFCQGQVSETHHQLIVIYSPSMLGERARRPPMKPKPQKPHNMGARLQVARVKPNHASSAATSNDTIHHAGGIIEGDPSPLPSVQPNHPQLVDGVAPPEAPPLPNVVDNVMLT